MNTQPKPKKELSESQINSAINIRKPMFLESARDLVKYLETQNDPLWWHNRPKFHYCVASFSSEKAKEWYEQHPEKRPKNDRDENQVQQNVNQTPLQQQPQNTEIPANVSSYAQNPQPQPVQQQPAAQIQTEQQTQEIQPPVQQQQQQLENTTGAQENSGGIKY